MVEEDDLDDTPREQVEEDENMRQEDPTTRQLSQILGHIEKLDELLSECDGVPIRREQAVTNVKNALLEYQTLFNSRVNARHQALITRYLHSNRNPQPPPAAAVAQPSSSQDNSDDDLSEIDASEVVEIDFEGFLHDDRHQVDDFEGFLEDDRNPEEEQ